MTDTTRACAECGGSLEGKRAGTSYCSARCADRARCRRRYPRPAADRRCEDCGVGISDRHWRAVRCVPCSAQNERRRGTARVRTLHDIQCQMCGASFQTRTKTTRFCSPTCAGTASHPGNVTRTCIVCDETFTVSRQYDRDTCSKPCTKWERQHPGEKPIRECGYCGKPIVGRHLDARYCSRRCSVAQRWRDTGKIAAPKSPVLDACLKCGRPLKGRTMRTKYCSRACQAVGQHERRSRKLSNAPVERVRSEVIFERDRWTCHLCGKKINRKLRDQHPLMASLDHIIPVDDPDYPGHVWENLAAAHLRCNIRKGAMASFADWMLYEALAAQRRAGAA